MRQIALAAGDLTPADRPDRVTDLARVTEFFIEEWPELMRRLTQSLERERAK
jgi:hypothetical protein